MNRPSKSRARPAVPPDALRFSRRADLAAGQPISELMARALANPEIISLAAGFVDQMSLPVDEARCAMSDLWTDADAARQALQYGTTLGYLPLREAILDGFLQAERPAGDADLAVDQVLLTAGSNQLLHLVAETLLDRDDIVLCTAPTYFVFLGTLRNLEARAVGVAVDDEGVVPEALEEQLRRLQGQGELPRVKAIYLVSYFDNPRGVTLSANRRQQVVELAARWSIHNHLYVIEDAAYRPLRYAGPDVPSLWSFDSAGDRVIVAGTFSKCFSP